MAIEPSRLQHCLDTIAARGSLGKKEALDLLEEVAERADGMRRSGAPDPFVDAAHELAGKLKERAVEDRLDAVRNARIRAALLDRIDSEAKGRIAPGRVSANSNPFNTALGLAEGLRSVLHWLPGAQRSDNVESLWVTLARQLISPIGNRLRREGLEKAALADGLRNEVAEAMWRLNGGAPDAATAVSRPAQQIAEAFMGPLKLIKERQNAVGARIGDAIDYVTHTSWNPRQLRLAAGAGADRDAAFQAWKARDVPRMAEKTFDGIEDREKFLRSLYDATESGVHLRGTSMAGFESFGDYVPPVYEGSHNIARSASQQRVVYWKNATAWADHMKEFGGGHSLYHDVVHTLDTGARRTALMTYLGTNPEGNFNVVARHLVERNRTSDDKGKLEARLNAARNALGRLDGSLNVPVREDAGQLTNQLMALEATAHLGGVSLTHLSAAPATFTSELVRHGVSRLEGLAQIVGALAKGRGSAEAQEALADAGAYAHGYALALQRAGGIGDAWRRDGLPGVTSWTAAHFMRLTGLPQILDQLQAHAVKSVLMSRLGRFSAGDFSAIEPHQRALLGRYGIGQREWIMLRNASDPTTVAGKRWLTPQDAINTNPKAVEELLRKTGGIGKKADAEAVAAAVKRWQWELGDKISMYLNDAADRAAVRPGVRERAMVLGKSRPGDPDYFIRRALAQFKMWPLAASMQILGRDIAQALSKKELASNIGVLLALSALGGSARMAVNDLASGRPQRDYKNPVTLLAALAQGGGLGIYGDFLFGETSRMSTGLVSTIGGPLAGDLDRMIGLYQRFKGDLETHPDKALKHMWPDLAHFAVGHVPFANLIYLKGALDYLLWYHLYEAASPGWWERTNRRLVKEQGRGMVGYRPGSGRIPYTPFALGQ